MYRLKFKVLCIYPSYDLSLYENKRQLTQWNSEIQLIDIRHVNATMCGNYSFILKYRFYDCRKLEILKLSPLLNKTILFVFQMKSETTCS